MRVVAGSAGGIRLHVPRTDLRPTMDRVKAAIFSSLGDRVSGAHVLDLFAGTGALGIEALSRGAASATFVESDRRAADGIRKNLAATDLAGRVHQFDVFHFLAHAAPEQWDLVFADPPYAQGPSERDFAAELLVAPALHSTLSSGGLFVLEKLPRQPLIFAPAWECLRCRKYGATEIVFLQPVQTSAAS